MSASDTALIVIDAQESFRHRPYFRAEELPPYIERQQALIDRAVAQGMKIVQIFHVEESGPFAEASGHVRTLEPLRITPDIVFRKGRHSAFVGTGLEAWLREQGVRRLVISGIRTEQCCETTTRHGSDLGFAVDYVGDATLTFPMTDRDGRVWSSREILARTELVLEGRFARIMRVADIAEPAYA